LSVEEQSKIVKMHNDKVTKNHKLRLRFEKVKRNISMKR
jgi:hypothetical protein